VYVPAKLSSVNESMLPQGQGGLLAGAATAASVCVTQSEELSLEQLVKRSWALRM
jgi:hypothetical protein